MTKMVPLEFRELQQAKQLQIINELIAIFENLGRNNCRNISKPFVETFIEIFVKTFVKAFVENSLEKFAEQIVEIFPSQF